MGYVLRFRFNKATHEVEFFTVDADADQAAALVEDGEHNRAHDAVTREIALRISRNPTTEELFEFFEIAQSAAYATPVASPAATVRQREPGARQ